MEGTFHKLIKQTVAIELEEQNFTTFQEPLESPYNYLWWHSYIPDVLATKKSEDFLKVILVECETHPNKKRIFQKMATIKKNLALQKRLYENTTFLPLLVIPPFNLTKILCSAIRSFWEIWIVNKQGRISYKIPRVEK